MGRFACLTGPLDFVAAVGASCAQVRNRTQRKGDNRMTTTTTPRQYTGRRTPHGPQISVIIYTEGGTSTAPLAHVVYHSPTGMEWGYAGSGPADTALSILADHFDEKPSEVRDALRTWAGRPALAAGLYQTFKREFVARWKSDWTIDSYAIDSWLAEPAVAEHLASWRARQDQYDEDQRVEAALDAEAAGRQQ